MMVIMMKNNLDSIILDIQSEYIKSQFPIGSIMNEKDLNNHLICFASRLKLYFHKEQVCGPEFCYSVPSYITVSCPKLKQEIEYIYDLVLKKYNISYEDFLILIAMKD